MGREMVAFGKSDENTRRVHTPAVSRRASQGTTRSEPFGERMVSPVMVAVVVVVLRLSAGGDEWTSPVSVTG